MSKRLSSYTPTTIGGCYVDSGIGICGGVKVNGKWNVKPHRDRIIHYGDKEIKVISETFEDGNNQDCPKLIRIQASPIIRIIERLSDAKYHVKDLEHITTECFHETGSVDDGILTRETRWPSIENYEMVYNGPQLYVSQPLYKNAHMVCEKTADYDTVDLTRLEENSVIRSNYKPIISLNKYKEQIKGFESGLDVDGKPIYDNWIDYCKVGFRKMGAADISCG